MAQTNPPPPTTTTTTRYKKLRVQTPNNALGKTTTKQENVDA